MLTSPELRDMKDELLALARRIDEIIDVLDDNIYGGVDHDGIE
jgi:hypothetical protein